MMDASEYPLPEEVVTELREIRKAWITVPNPSDLDAVHWKRINEFCDEYGVAAMQIAARLVVQDIPMEG